MARAGILLNQKVEGVQQGDSENIAVQHVS